MTLQQLNGAWFELSHHAVRRALDMALSEEQIRGTLGNPRHVLTGKAGREMWTRDKLTAVMEPHDGYWGVVTFLWATPDAWRKDRESVKSRRTGQDADALRKFRYQTKMRKKGLGR